MQAPVLGVLVRARAAPIVCVTKPTVSEFLIAQLSPKTRPTVVICSSVPTAESCRVLQSLADSGLGSVLFLGDLDPTDLVIYFALATGGLVGKRHPVRVEYGGIDDDWLAFAAGNFRPDRKEKLEDFVAQPMDKAETRVWACLATQLDVQRLVGSRCAQVLGRGQRIEIEAFMNPHLYREGYSRRLSNWCVRRR